MPQPRRHAGDGDGRLQRCIRDLAALNALPSMCVGRSPDEALEIVLDALPTALDCDFVYLRLPGTPAREHGTLLRKPMSEAELAQVRAVTAADADGTDAQLFLSDGRRFWCLEAEVPVSGERGRLLAGRAAPLDPETDRVLVRTAANVVGTTLETASVLDVARRKDDFLAMLGHELRNPLAPILTAVELLARNPSVAREQAIIQRHTRHLSRLVDDLLDISRVTRGHVELRWEDVSVPAVLERAVEIASPLIARHQHELRVAPAGDLTVKGDPVRLAQVFGNLLTNAAKFTPPGGHIEVSIERLPGAPAAGANPPGGRPPDRVRVTVQDDGCGIAADQLGRIFEPFVQADRERDALRGGLGLGLAIVDNLVKRHGGIVTARSDGPGRGAAFIVELPLVARARQAEPVAPARPVERRAGLRVLIVDDNVDLALLLGEALEGEGFVTAVEHDARAALDRWRSFVPHAAVLDVGLPDLDGYQLARALRAEHGRGATLIAATGYGQPTDRFRAADAGFDCHLVKPVSLHELVDILDERAAAGEGPGPDQAPRV